MIKIASSCALVAAAALTLTACGGGSGGGNSDQKAAAAQLSSIESAVAQASSAVANMTASDSSDASDGSSPSDSSSTPDGDASKVDVCALLSPADAIGVARADKLDNAQTVSSIYKLTKTKQESGQENSSACRFDLTDGNAEGTVLFQVEVGSHIDFYTDGTKVDGLGDEAYTNSNGGTVVRVGGLLITEGDDALGSQITLDLLRKMAPNLK